MYILAQIIGAIGLIIITIGMQCREKKNIILAQAITNTCITIQYFLLGATTGAILFIINTTRSLTFYLWDQKGKKPNIYLLLLFTSIAIITGIYSYKNIFSLLAIISSVVTTYGVWQKSATKLRIIMLFCNIILVIHDIYFKAYTGMLTYIMVVISTTISLIKIDILKKDNKKITK